MPKSTLLRKKLSIYKKKVWGMLGLDIVKNVNHENHNKRCLLVYITFPFKEKMVSDRHQNFWQAKELARLIGNEGYQVDVIDYQNPYTKPRGLYALVIGLIPRNIDVYSSHLCPGAKKIAYLTSSNLTVSGEREIGRIEKLYERRGVKLKPRRQGGAISKSIESFDGALFFGNDYNLRTYAEFNMPPVYYIVNNGYDYDFEINFDKDPKKFLYFGSAGQIHKGLDLLLEIFSQTDFPCELYVCGTVRNEEDFEHEYVDELYHTDNIHTLGFVDVHSKTFEKLANECAYSILPSCAEGQAGSVVTAMSAGIISIVSKECGYDSEDVILLPDCEKETIEAFIRKYSNMDKDWIRKQCLNAFQNAKENHSKECFTKSIKSGLEAILKV